MMDGNLPLLIILALGLLFENGLITASAGIVLVLRALDLNSVLNLLEHRALQTGLIFLTISVLTPFAREREGLDEIARSLSSWPGLMAVLGGALAASISAPGVKLLQSNPEVIVGLMVGTILGVLVFKGIPVGPLAASGLAAIFLYILDWIKE